MGWGVMTKPWEAPLRVPCTPSIHTPPHPTTDPAVGAGCLSREVEHVVQGQQARGHAPVLGRVVLGAGERQLRTPQPSGAVAAALWREGEGAWVGVTHREAQFAGNRWHTGNGDGQPARRSWTPVQQQLWRRACSCSRCSWGGC